MFHNFTVKIAPLKNDMNIRGNTIKWEFIIKNTANPITHDHHLIKGSRDRTLDKLTSIEMYSRLILKVQNKPLIFTSKIF